ncbi:unnamed protein product [Malus baccata var. baccata]|uniref:Uncharacterized protein n=1 Tax=Malus domestica TaxID=3750 RepID=A0A498KDT5_MALDO|nr:hypothetical protein DVH24_018381 [Malus domestica]
MNLVLKVLYIPKGIRTNYFDNLYILIKGVQKLVPYLWDEMKIEATRVAQVSGFRRSRAAG